MRAAVASLLLLVLGGCSLSTDVNDYVFVDSPCPRPAHECSGGRTMWFVISKNDIARSSGDMGQIVPGFDIDGTTDAVCGHRDQISPEGTPGIDNATTPLLSVVEDPMHPFPEATLDAILAGQLTIIQLSNVDDLANDDCIDMQIRQGLVPRGEDPATYLDADSDRVLDPNLVVDVGGLGARDKRACTVGGVLHAYQGDTAALLPITADPTAGPAEVETAALHTRAIVSEDGLTDAWEGGGLAVEDVVAILRLSEQPGLVSLLQRAADLYPGPDGSCSHLSFSFTFEAIPFTPSLGGAAP